MRAEGEDEARQSFRRLGHGLSAGISVGGVNTVAKRKEPWFVFFDSEGVELCAITVNGTFAGEISATIDLLAYEHGISPVSISFAEITR